MRISKLTIDGVLGATQHNVTQILMSEKKTSVFCIQNDICLVLNTIFSISWFHGKMYHIEKLWI